MSDEAHEPPIRISIHHDDRDEIDRLVDTLRRDPHGLQKAEALRRILALPSELVADAVAGRSTPRQVDRGG